MVAKYQTWIWAFQIYEYFTEIAMSPKRGSYYLILGREKKGEKKKRQKKRMASCFKPELSSLICKFHFKVLIVVIIDCTHFFPGRLPSSSNMLILLSCSVSVAFAVQLTILKKYVEVNVNFLNEVVVL